MQTTIKKWGNSLGIHLPLIVTNQAKIIEGSTVTIVVKKNRIEIIPFENSELSLKQMLSKIKPENLHNEFDTGHSVGNEL